MGRKRLLVLGFIIFACLHAVAQSGPSAFDFIENKGQWDSKVQLMGKVPGGTFFLHSDGFTIDLQHQDDMQRMVHRHHAHESIEGKSAKGGRKDGSVVVDAASMKVRSHNLRVVFEGSNPNPEIVREKPLKTFNNYFIGSDPKKWATNVQIFQAVTYKNVYPNIDVRYYSEAGKLKYDIIVNPGGDWRKIALRYRGADNLKIRNRELLIQTSIGEIKELYPYSFQFDKSKGRTEVATKYVLEGKDLVKFNVSNYSTSSTLVIDPTLVFSTFSGSTADEYGFTATPAPDGSFFAGSIVFGPGFRVTPGAYQADFVGGEKSIDVGLTKFSADGTQRLYGTYLGGSGNDAPHSLFSDAQGNLVVMGRTYSGSDFPGRKEGVEGGCDIFVTKLNATGTGLIGSLRIGGSGSDGVNIEDQIQNTVRGQVSLFRNYGDDSRSEVILDGQSNIYVAAQSQSKDFPTTANSFQRTLSGAQDGVVMKITPDCNSIIWASFLGGTLNDGAFVLALQPSTGNLYVAGATESSDFPGDKTGSYSGSLGGATDIDGFVAIISNGGNAIIKSTYLGTNAVDVIYGIQFDRFNFPYVMGITKGQWPVVNAPYSNRNAKQFVAKLQENLSGFVYSTTFGSVDSRSPNMSPVAFLVDRCENVYISGWGGWNRGGQDPYDLAGVRGMPISADAIKSSTDNRDFYFIVIKKNAEDLLYGSYFGQNEGGNGEHVDGGTSRFDGQGAIYQAICANCGGGATFPTTPGVVGPSNGAAPNGCNLAAVKILFNFAGVIAAPQVLYNNQVDSIGCVPFTVTLRDTIRNGKNYQWDFGDGSPAVTTASGETTHTFNATGLYRVRLIAIDSSACNIRDTAFISVIVRDDPASLAFTSTKLLPCESLSYQFDNLSTAPATKPFGPSSFTWDFGDGTAQVVTGPNAVNHSYAAPGTYIVKLTLTDSNYCNAPETIETTLRVAPLVEAQFETPPTGCAPYEASFTNTSLAGLSFVWDFGDGTTSTEVNPVHLYASPGTYTIKMVATDPGTCNLIDSTEQTIVVYESPTAEFTHTPMTPIPNTPTVFTNLSVNAVRYKWLFGDGDSVEKNTPDTVAHQYNATGVYQACLIAYNAAGCPDTVCHEVQATVNPLLDVPTAFTPGRFGRNSTIRVEGFGIARMTWRIYNRWGQVVFEGNDRRAAWDGTFKGQLQPVDVYAYTLDVEFTDGTKARKTGDITLLR